MQSPDLNHLFAQAPVAICIVSGPNYLVELVNERMLQFLGRAKDIIGHPLAQTLTEAKQQGLLAILDKVRTTRQPFYVAEFPSVILIDGIREARYFSLVFKPYYLNSIETEPSGIFCVAHNITEAVLTRQKLEEEKQRTTLALQTGGLGMLATDWTNGIVTADKRAAEIFGYEDTQSVDAYLSRIHPEDAGNRLKAIEDGKVSGSFDFEVRLLLPDGTTRWVRSRGLLQKNSDGIATGSFGVVQDITNQKQFAEALRQEVEQRTADLQRSNANLEEFARAASHDLKEPVRKMQVFASRLRETLSSRLTNEEKHIFSRMENAASRMGRLVDDLLEYSRLNHVFVEPEDIDLTDKLTRIVSDLELLVAEKKASIDIGALPIVRGHRRQLEQLFQNLLINALKYSRDDELPRISVAASRVSAEDLRSEMPVAGYNPSPITQHFYQVKVTDNGIGFHPDDAEKIFNVFTRLHSRDSYSGTGIGLSIAKKVVENHGGYIYANGEPGKGACFTVLLPAE